ncbi:hypothetical protein GCM10020331_086670 [Ectobacillus funiculus]
MGLPLELSGWEESGKHWQDEQKGFNMNILYSNRSRKPVVEEELGVQYAEMDRLLQESDFVCIMTPYTAETKNLIGERELSLMKSTSILINTARGGIVNEKCSIPCVEKRKYLGGWT